GPWRHLKSFMMTTSSCRRMRSPLRSARMPTENVRRRSSIRSSISGMYDYTMWPSVTVSPWFDGRTTTHTRNGERRSTRKSPCNTGEPGALRTSTSITTTNPIQMKTLLNTDTTNASYAIIRVVLGLVILPHGLQKLFGAFDGAGFGPTMQYFTEDVGLPWVLGFLVI